MIQIKKDVLLSDYSNYKIGGRARLFAEVNSVAELKEILRGVYPESSRRAQDDNQNIQNDRVFILGSGTNVLISDKGFDGLVIHNKIGGIKHQGSTLTVGSGVLVSDLLDFCIENSLSGLEWAGGLPGTVGGAVRGNAGAFKGETKDSVLEVRSLDLKTFQEKTRANSECNFGYRNSIFKSGKGKEEFITWVSFSLEHGSKEEIQKAIREKIEYRKARHPLEYPNIGSIFKNVPFESLTPVLKEELKQYVKNDPFPVVPTAKIIFLASLKGKRIGGAMVSDKHTNFIINFDNAKAEDVKQLIALEKKVIKDKFGISIEEEIIYLGN